MNPSPQPTSGELPARERVRATVTGRAGGISSGSCPWRLESAEFVNLSSRGIVVREFEISLRHFGKGPKKVGDHYDPPPGVAQTVSVHVVLDPYARHLSKFGGGYRRVTLDGCQVSAPPRITEAEFVD